MSRLENSPTVWFPERVERLRNAYRAGGREAAFAAFPEMRRPAVKGAIVRYVLAQPSAPPVPCDRPIVRRKIASLPVTLVLERLADLLLGGAA